MLEQEPRRSPDTDRSEPSCSGGGGGGSSGSTSGESGSHERNQQDSSLSETKRKLNREAREQIEAILAQIATPTSQASTEGQITAAAAAETATIDSSAGRATSFCDETPSPVCNGSGCAGRNSNNNAQAPHSAEPMAEVGLICDTVARDTRDEQWRENELGCLERERDDGPVGSSAERRSKAELEREIGAEIGGRAQGLRQGAGMQMMDTARAAPYECSLCVHLAAVEASMSGRPDGGGGEARESRARPDERGPTTESGLASDCKLADKSQAWNSEHCVERQQGSLCIWGDIRPELVGRDCRYQVRANLVIRSKQFNTDDSDPQRAPARPSSAHPKLCPLDMSETNPANLTADGFNQSCLVSVEKGERNHAGAAIGGLQRRQAKVLRGQSLDGNKQQQQQQQMRPSRKGRKTNSSSQAGKSMLGKLIVINSNNVSYTIQGKNLRIVRKFCAAFIPKGRNSGN